jgi:hypothetical protein
MMIKRDIGQDDVTKMDKHDHRKKGLRICDPYWDK